MTEMRYRASRAIASQAIPATPSLGTVSTAIVSLSFPTMVSARTSGVRASDLARNMAVPAMVSPRRYQLPAWHQARETAVLDHLKQNIYSGVSAQAEPFSAWPTRTIITPSKSKQRQTGNVHRSGADSTSRLEIYMSLNDMQDRVGDKHHTPNPPNPEKSGGINRSPSAAIPIHPSPSKMHGGAPPVAEHRMPRSRTSSAQQSSAPFPRKEQSNPPHSPHAALQQVVPLSIPSQVASLEVVANLR